MIPSKNFYLTLNIRGGTGFFLEKKSMKVKRMKIFFSIYVYRLLSDLGAVLMELNETSKVHIELIHHFVVSIS